MFFFNHQKNAFIRRKDINRKGIPQSQEIKNKKQIQLLFGQLNKFKFFSNNPGNGFPTQTINN